MRDVTLPMTISVPILLLYMIICALVVQYYDETEDIRTGLDFKNSFYFAFISLSTIGLGDIMPNNLQCSPLVALLFLCGLSLVSMVNASAYSRMEDGFHFAVRRAEGALERIYNERRTHRGHKILKCSPLVALLFLCGLSLVSMVNASAYSRMEDGFHFAVRRAEGALERIYNERRTHRGHTILKVKLIVMLLKGS
uniref:Ion_trans_2 domain-containing protein n=1 Tax=Ascaris lumbricoides TaxID=6252 RepID=A0A0M3IVG0_ASCLU